MPEFLLAGMHLIPPKRSGFACMSYSSSLNKIGYTYKGAFLSTGGLLLIEKCH